MGILKKKNIIMIVIAAALLTGGGVTAVMLVRSSNSASAVETALELAEKYLLEQDYEQAVIEFSKILEIELMNVDAYIGLADAYIGLGNNEKAIEVLSEGYKMTQNEDIKARLDALTGNTEMSSQEAVTVKEPANSEIDTSQTETVDTSETVVTTGRTDRYPVSELDYECVDSMELLVYEQYQDENGTITTKDYIYEYLYDANDNIVNAIVTGTSTEIFTIDNDGKEKFSYTSEIDEYDDSYFEDTIYYNEHGDVDKKIYIIRNTVNYSETQTFSYEYGEYGPISCLCTSTYDEEGTVRDETDFTEYIYDSMGNLIREDLTYEIDGETRTYTRFNYSYDSLGRLITKGSRHYLWEYTYAGDTSKLIEEKEISQQADMIISHTKWDSNGLLLYKYEVSPSQNLTKEWEWERLPDGRVTKYTFTRIHNDNTYTSSSEYIRDDEGNRIRRIHTDSNGIQSIHTYTTEIDDMGREVEREFAPDGIMVGYTITEW